ncbi:hypothetical protein O0L34_g111 [Tuta absoluta]|nr:hypothetical protein O0L34_g111 [Tuta absoluta]
MDNRIVVLLAISIATVFCDHDKGLEQKGKEERLYPEEVIDHLQLTRSGFNCPCGRNYSPVCASDGNTYNNRCLFECRANFLRDHGGHLAVVKFGRCDGSD